MSRRYSTRLFQKVLVPVIYGIDPNTAINAATLIAEKPNITLAGIVGIAEGESLSAAAVPARHLRKILRAATTERGVRALQRIRAVHGVWDELIHIVQEEKPDLLVLE